MPGPYAPDDTLIGPIVHQIAEDIRTQIPSITYVWEEEPDRAPSNNQVVLPLTRIRQVSDTNGKLKIEITVSMRHLFRRTELDSGVRTLRTYIMPWLRLLAAWPNATLDGLAIKMTATEVRELKLMLGGQAFIALGVDFVVLTEFNIDLT